CTTACTNYVCLYYFDCW
nr:immunoglobulin heavy chain junction region [Macaca mulatta]MOW21636.1 immunoglobulin heavy chain junction region [Macaca mulatta]